MYTHIQKVGLLLLLIGMAFAMNGCSNKNKSFEINKNDLINVEVGLRNNIADNNSTNSFEISEQLDSNTSSNSNENNTTLITDNNSTAVTDNNSTLMISNQNKSSVTNNSLTKGKDPLVFKGKAKSKSPLIVKGKTKTTVLQEKKEEPEKIKPKTYIIKAEEFFLK